MAESIDKLLKELKLNQPATKRSLEEVEEKLGIVFPQQYVEFMMKSNGAVGSIGDTSFVQIWPIEEIIPSYEGYELEEFTPGLVYLGSDGGGMAYAFDKRDERMPIVEIPFESIHIEDAKLCRATFNEFLEYLYLID